MANMPDAIENTILAYLVKGTTPAALSTPMRVQLVSALGSGDAASTPISGQIQTLTTGTPSGGAVDNTTLIRFEAIPNPTTVAGYRIIDSAGTPVVTLDNIPKTGGSVSVTDGILEIAIGDLDFTAA